MSLNVGYGKWKPFPGISAETHPQPGGIIVAMRGDECSELLRHHKVLRNRKGVQQRAPFLLLPDIFISL